ncbi:MAG: cobalamin biosynthesis protein, partial [Deltaproteobacteria bacterium]|nr:cobalamin biosynthesis protein [Deltaproteobacteria bacterium]
GRPGAAAFTGKVAVYALTPAAVEPARRLLVGLPATGFFAARLAGQVAAGEGNFFPAGGFRQQVRDNWRRYDGHLFIMAAGIVLRTIAGLLADKTVDPAVVAADERGEYCISLLSGHIGGANRLARQAAALLGGQAVITTATDVQGLLAFDELAASRGWQVLNPEQIKALNSLLLARRPIGIACEPEVFQRFFAGDESLVHVPAGGETSGLAGLVVVDDAVVKPQADQPVLFLRRPRLALGIGCRRGVAAAAIDDAVTRLFARHGFSPAQVAAVASVDVKRDEEGLLAFASGRGWPLTFFAAAELAAVEVPSPSVRVREAVGSPSVSEAAALLAAGGKLLVPKEKFGALTLAVAAWPPAPAAAGSREEGLQP